MVYVLKRKLLERCLNLFHRYNASSTSFPATCFTPRHSYLHVFANDGYRLPHSIVLDIIIKVAIPTSFTCGISLVATCLNQRTTFQLTMSPSYTRPHIPPVRSIIEAKTDDALKSFIPAVAGVWLSPRTGAAHDWFLRHSIAIHTTP